MRWFLLVALMVLVSLVLVVGFSRAADKEIQTVITQVQNKQISGHGLPATVNAGYHVNPTRYYLSKEQVNGDLATDACSTGFHMANLYEIIDKSNLQYATGLPSAFSDIISIDDQRDGPPTIDFGWVRAEYASTPDPSRDPYESLNCNNESISTEAEWGIVARLYDIVTASQMNSEWVGVCARQCNQHYRVWCVENI
jgi:hypothetical protein